MNINAVAMLPGGARFLSGSDDYTAKLWTLDGALESTFRWAAGRTCPSRRCPTACTLWSPLAIKDIRLYHVDGTLVHTFEGHVAWCARWR